MNENEHFTLRALEDVTVSCGQTSTIKTELIYDMDEYDLLINTDYTFPPNGLLSVVSPKIITDDYKINIEVGFETGFKRCLSPYIYDEKRRCMIIKAGNPVAIAYLSKKNTDVLNFKLS
ncbi:MAG: hypothetical protein RSB41_03390 [Bacilli bacterium]